MRMPRFLQPFSRRDRGVQSEYLEDSHVPRYNTYDYDHSRVPNATRSGSRWRNFLKRGRQRDVVYVNDAGEEYRAPPSEVGRVPMAMPSSRRARVDDYSESSITDSDSIPVRYPRQGSEAHFVPNAPPSQGSFVQEPGHFMHRVPSHESFPHPESISPPLDQVPSVVPPFVAPPGEVYMEGPPASQVHENVSEYTQEPPVIQGEPRRFRPRRGEPITVGGVRIEVDDDGRHRRHRGRRSRSRSIDSYSSGATRSSRSYTSASSFEEQPIIISADPNTEIEIGNERDGFVPYEQYLADREARRRARRHHHRRTPEEEIYVVPAGANVIFVDEDGRELHRVGDFDDRYSGRRRNSRARTTRQMLPEYDGRKDTPTSREYTECGIQTGYVEAGADEPSATAENSTQRQVEDNLALQMHEKMRLFMESRPPSRSSSPLKLHGEESKIFHPSRSQLLGNQTTATLFRPPSPRPCRVGRRAWR